MTAFQIRRVQNSSQQQASHALREQLLRAPWDQTLEADRDIPADDLIGIHAGHIIASGRLFLSEDGKTACIRGMATDPAHQGQGRGAEMLRALEICARGRGCTHIALNARTTALGFYQRAGFTEVGPGPELFGKIPHRLMRKRIDHADYQPWGLQLRPACDTDTAALQQLIFGCLAEFGMQPEHDGIDRDLENLEATYAQGAFWVLTGPADTIVASIGMLPLASPGHFELRRMYLKAEQRGRNLGRALLGTALHWAHTHDARFIELETATALKQARELYTWVGFRQIAGELETRRCDQRMGMPIAHVVPATV